MDDHLDLMKGCPKIPFLLDYDLHDAIFRAGSEKDTVSTGRSGTCRRRSSAGGIPPMRIQWGCRQGGGRDRRKYNIGNIGYFVGAYVDRESISWSRR
jgi:hypothetical protein